MQKTTTSRLIVKFHILLKELKLEHEKDAMLSGYGVSSSKDLSAAELEALIQSLETLKEKYKEKTSPAVRRLRSQVLNNLANIGIVNEGNAQNYWSRVNKYLSQPRIAGKLLYEMNEAELEACRRKLFAVAKEVKRREQDEKYWATHN